MKKRVFILLCLLVAVSLFSLSCSGAVSTTSVDGATVTTGLELNDDLTIRSSKTTFRPDEGFIISFDNNAPFDASIITMRIEDTDAKEVIGSVDYDVDPSWTIASTEGSLNEAGKYKISFMVNGKTRASQTVIIE